MSYKQEAAKSHKVKVKGYADGGVVVDGRVDTRYEAAKRRLAAQLQQQQDESQDMTLSEQDRRDANQEAWRSGDYAPNARGGFTYKPWSPKRGID